MTEEMVLRDCAKAARKVALEEGRAIGMEEGLAKGLEEGANKNRRETALRMLKANIAVDVIQIATGYTEEEILALAKENV